MMGSFSALLLLLALTSLGAAAVAAVRAPRLSSHATLQLSQARSDLGAAVADGAAVFAGGCSAGSTGGGTLGGGCKDPSDVVDILRPSNATTSEGDRLWAAEAVTASLSKARGWPAVCSFGPAQEWLAVLGGGDPNPNTALDLISIKNGFMLTNASAMPSGRWGTSCAAAQDGSQVAFGGGKHYYVHPPMADEVYVTGPPNPNGNPFWRPSLTLAGKFSEPREDCGAVGYGPKGALFAGGWVSNTEPGNPSISVDAFNLDLAAGPPTHSAWKPGLAKPSAQQEWVGAVAWNETTVFLADSTTLYEVNSADIFSGVEQALRRPLPAAVAASAGIPSARIQQNGVRIPGAVCFYASAPKSVLLCWSPLTSEWQTLPCTETHVAGAIAVADNVVFVGGGFGVDQKTVHATVDVFTFGL
jgi:hypothetical protein